MNEKRRVLVGIGAIAAVIGIVAAVRHCLRSMAGLRANDARSKGTAALAA
jgi:hypothetical protein